MAFHGLDNLRIGDKVAGVLFLMVSRVIPRVVLGRIETASFVSGQLILKRYARSIP